MTVIRTQQRGLGVLTDVLLAQVSPAETAALESVGGRTGGGMVVSGRSSAVFQAISYLHGRSFRQPLLADRERYKGNGRLPAGHQFDPDWIGRQRRLNLPVIMPDAGYIAESDVVGLRSVLERSAAIPGAIAPLALANWWLYGTGLQLLLAELRDVNIPIAVIMEHKDDPLGVRRIFDGLLTVIRTGIPVIPLRCDVNSVGLLAHGALAAAFGSRTALRHLYPIAKSSGGRPAKESAFWPAGLALHYCDKLYDAVLASPTDLRWLCDCTICDGLRIDRLATTAVEDVRHHNFACLLDLRRRITRLPSPAERIREWTSWARRGVEAHYAVDSGTVELSAPKALQHWQNV